MLKKKNTKVNILDTIFQQFPFLSYCLPESCPGLQKKRFFMGRGGRGRSPKIQYSTFLCNCVALWLVLKILPFLENLPFFQNLYSFSSLSYAFEFLFEYLLGPCPDFVNIKSLSLLSQKASNIICWENVPLSFGEFVFFLFVRFRVSTGVFARAMPWFIKIESLSLFSH